MEQRYIIRKKKRKRKLNIVYYIDTISVDHYDLFKINTVKRRVDNSYTSIKCTHRQIKINNPD